MPSTGEVMVQYERLSCAVSSCAFACSTAAAACSYWPVASSRSFCESAFCCASGFVREKTDVGLVGLHTVDHRCRVRHRDDREWHAEAARELAHQIGDRAGDGAGFRIDASLDRIRGEKRRAQRAGGRQVGTERRHGDDKREQHDNAGTDVLKLPHKHPQPFVMLKPVITASTLWLKRIPYTPSVDWSLPGTTSWALS